MANLISRLLPSLVGGVSQQPDVLRHDNQCEVMENALPSIVHGLEKRPGTEWITSLTSNADGSVAGHLINRDTNERYVALFTGDATEPIEIFTIGGIKCDVKYGDYSDTAPVYDPTQLSTVTEVGYNASTFFPDTYYGDKGLEISNSSGVDWDFDKLKVYITGSDSSMPINVRVQGISGGLPDGTDLAVGTLSSWSIGLNTITLDTAVDLNNGETCAILFDIVYGDETDTWISFRASDDGETMFQRPFTDDSEAGVWTEYVDENDNYSVLDDKARLPIWVQIYEEDFTEDTSYKDYFLASNPKTSIKTTTIADYTIASNKEVVPEMSGTDTTAWPEEALLWVRRAYDDCHYNVYIDGTLAENASEGYTALGDTSSYDTVKEIRDKIYTELDADHPSGWTFTKLGVDMIHIVKGSGDAFEISVSDGYGGEALKCFEKAVQKYQDLPPRATDGFILEVTGDQANQFSNYYVEYEASGASQEGTGVWNEVTKPGQDDSFDATTMPHQIVRTGSNEFAVSPVSWEDRAVGDEDTSSEPTFIGNSINDIFFFKNRLGILAGENVILSRTADFFNFWRGTSLELLDDDPIDQAVSSNQVANLRHAISYQKDLLLLSDQEQFVFSSEGLLSPSSVSIDTTTRFEVAKDCTPVGLGANVYFAVPKDDYSAVREYFVQPDTVVDDASDVTAHIPNYIPSDVNLMTGSASHDILLVGETGSTDIYVYKFFWNGAEKAQSAWGKWVLPYNVYWMGILDNYIYIIGDDDTDIIMEKVNLEKITSGTLNFRVHLDRVETITGGSYTTVTPFTMSYKGSSTASDWCVVDPVTGEEYTVDSIDNTGSTSIVKVDADLEDEDCIIGLHNTMLFQFSDLGIKADEKGVDRIVGRLMIKTLTFAMKATGYFKVVFTPNGRPTQTHEFGPYTTMKSAHKRFFVRGNAKDPIKIVNDSYLPCALQAVTYEGKYFTRSNAIQ